MIKDLFADAHKELLHNFEDYVQEDVATYRVIPFGGNVETILKRFDLYPDVLPESEWVYDEIQAEADSELKQLKKVYPEVFDSRFQYGFEWNEGEFALCAYLSRDEYENNMKTSNPKYEPMFLSWCKSLDEEIDEMRSLISGDPSDKRQLKEELVQLLQLKHGSSNKKRVTKKKRLKLVKNPNYLTQKSGLIKKIEKLMDNGFEVYTDEYRTSISKDEINVPVLHDENAFITSDLFRYTDYGGAYSLAKANIRYIEENYEDLVNRELIQSYSTAHNGENMEFKFEALENGNLYKDLLGLDGYPVLSDDTLSEVEREIEEECWDSYGRDEFRQAVDEKFEGELTLSDEELDTLAYEAAQYTSEGMGHVDRMDFTFDIDGLIEALDNVMKDDEKEIKKENPSWVRDEDVWEKAKKQSLKSYGKISYPFVVYIYKQMGGKIKKGKK